MSVSFDFRGIHCIASTKDATTWYFLPGHPDVQRAPDGRPLVTLIDMGATGYVAFTASWAASRQDLQALREDIAAGHPALRGEHLVLAFAPVVSPRCDVLMGDGSGSFDTVATSATSGFPPYDATFNLHLEGERVAHTRAALRGERGRLAVEYTAELRMPVAAKADFRAVGADLVAAMGGEWDRDSIRQMLELAVRDSRARVVIEAPDFDASHLVTELYDRVIDRAAELLPRVLRQGVPSELHVTAELVREVGLPTSSFADVATLLGAKAMNFDRGDQDAAD